MEKKEALKYKVPTYRIKMVRDNRGGQPLTMRPDNAAQVLGHNIGDVPYEEVWLLTLNARAQITGAIKVGQGGAHGVGLTTRDIMTPLAVAGASGFVMGHNHPSGDPTPSQHDLELTRNVERAAQVLNIPLLDHIVVAREPKGSIIYHSMFEAGELASL